MTDPTRRLVLLRHASAEPSAVGGDEARPLTDQGLEEARRAGAALKELGALGEVVVCSPALRTRETWATVDEETGHGVLIDMEPAIYEASVEDLYRVVHDLDATAPEALNAVLVGHAPGLPTLAYELCDGRAPDDLLDVVARRFVPASFAILEWSGQWQDAAAGVARLVDVRAGDEAATAL